MLRYTNLIISVLLIFFSNSKVNATEVFEGAVLFSFEPNYFFVLSEEKIYQVNERQLSSQLSSILYSSSVSGKKFSGVLPSSSIVHTWPYAPSGPRHQKTNKEIKSFIKIVNNEAQFHGQIIYSHEDQLQWIKINNDYYRLHLNEVSKEI
ncbi:MAG: hypothetical protein KDD34_02260, partial [Bdellovibrionales bacterium]|nr:hypothetical protein [Bdellovibrionales bacterium]